jgi:Holliday junction resolvase RusA-like endonuclease
VPILKITFPWFLKELKPNWSGHYMQKAKAKAIYRSECERITLNTMRDTWKASNKLRITFYKPNNRHMDLDNMLASIKSGIDGMCDALQVNDKQFTEIILIKADTIGGYIDVELL